MEWLTDPTIWVGLATLVALEIVLGVDNLIFIAILAGRLPPRERERARRIGLMLALVTRLALLAGISWVMSLTKPVFTVGGHGVSWRDLILIAGGVFLLVKATMEIHDRLEAQPAEHPAMRAGAFWPVVAQIVALDIVFSLDSVITAVGMVDELYVMMGAVIIAVGVMLVAANPLSAFITARPSLIILCLGFLLMIGLVLVVDGLGVHVPKGYVYAAIAFSVMIETFNQIARRNRRKLAEAMPPRQRVARAVLRLLGGVPLSGPGALAAEPADATAQAPQEEVFTPLERSMVRGVLELSRRPITAIMTHRSNVDWIDALAGRDAVLESVRASRYREFPVGRGSLDKLAGIARKEDVLAAGRDDGRFVLDAVVREPVAAPAGATILDVLELFKRAPLELVIVVDEYGGFEGIVTRTDLLEAIAGDLPKVPDKEPRVSQLPDGALSIDGTLPLPDLQQRLRLDGLPEGTYHTAAGLVLAILGRVPKSGDTAECCGWRLEVMEMEGLSVKRLVARRGGRTDEG
jgi:predicted tellurium resistance membrane protein TerC/Mg2+/Co2+ transporter CorC